MHSSHRQPSLDTAQADQLGLTMTQVFSTPLAALRSSMEALASDFRQEDPRGKTLQSALDQVSRMTRDVQALVELTTPRDVQPLRCAVEEIVDSALRPRTFAQLARLQVARQENLPPIVVDGPLLATALSHLLEGALESSRGPVLLQVRPERDEIVFAVVREDSDGPGGEMSTSRNASLGLGMALARRDLDRIGARMEFERSEQGRACLRIWVPLVANVDATKAALPSNKPASNSSKP